MPGLPPGRPTSVRPVASVLSMALCVTLLCTLMKYRALAVPLSMLSCLPTVIGLTGASPRAAPRHRRDPSPFYAEFTSTSFSRGSHFLSTMAWYDDGAAAGEWYWSGDRRGGVDPRQQLLDGNVDAASAMQSTSKVPPYWEPSLERRGYPMRTWIQDIGIWATATELQQEQIAGVVV